MEIQHRHIFFIEASQIKGISCFHLYSVYRKIFYRQMWIVPKA